MALHDPRLQRIHETILDAFKREELTSLLLLRMSVHFEQVVTPGPLQEQVRELLAWTERQGRTLELIGCAREQVPGNAALAALHADAQAWGPRVAPAPPPAPPTPAEAAYLRGLLPECNSLPLGQEARDLGGDAEPPKLAHVYVHLATETPADFQTICDRLGVPQPERARLAQGWQGEALLRGGEGTPDRQFDRDGWKQHPLAKWAKDKEQFDAAFAPLSALETLQRKRRLILLGDPGSGKSAFANHLTLTMAGALLRPDGDWQPALEGRFAAPLFPLRLLVRRWSAALEAGARPGVALLVDALKRLTGDGDALQRRLEVENTLVIVDGLDEAPSARRRGQLDRRAVVVQSVQEFLEAYPLCYVLVTSRVKPYEQGHAKLHGLDAHRLAPLDDPRIAAFTHKWYAEMARTQAECTGGPDAARERLLASIGERPRLREMAGTPLLLTMLARVNARRGLPDSRAELYDWCVEQLLWEWERRKEEEAGGDFVSLHSLLRQPEQGLDLERGDVERELWELTFAAHERSGAHASSIPADALEKKLAALHPDPTVEGKAWAGRVVNLMAERGGLLVYDGVDSFTFPHPSFQEYLAARRLLEQEFADARAAELAQSDGWREVVLLAASTLSFQKRYGAAQALIRELAEGEARDDGGRRRLLTAGQAWQEFGPQRARGATGNALRDTLPGKLVALMQDADAPAAVRLEAGLRAADLGDLPPDLDAFIPIPGLTVRIGKYPVTNAQFRRFVDAGGYASENEKRWWSKQGIKYKRQYGWTEPRWWDDRRFNRATQPVVGVSWYEAEAYCAWLNDVRSGLRDGERARRPTQAEWEAAARGGQPKPKDDAQDYPWRGPFRPALANTEESSLRQTTPVHMYPAGATPEGIFDLAGNVWEWSEDFRSEIAPWLRGGSWQYSSREALVSSADTSEYVGGEFFVCTGFRVVVVPDLSG